MYINSTAVAVESNLLFRGQKYNPKMCIFVEIEHFV